MIDDAVTLKEGSHTSEAGMIIVSRMVDRQPRADKPIAVLLQKAMRTPEIFRAPEGMAFCSACGDWRPENYFVRNASRKRGYDYECKQCKRERMDWHRATQAAAEGRERRRYFKVA